TGATAGTTTGGAAINYNGFSAASSTSVTGAGDYNDTTSATRGMTFASATSVTGTGSITNAAGLFTLTAANRGTTTGGANRAYDGYTAASSTSVTGAGDDADNTKTTRGMTFANATSVTGTGSITRAAGLFTL